jgi:mannose-6-phosphate isomerase-like protein (cupin superfamily)/DNA-binding XRE family transcriptional regulator
MEPSNPEIAERIRTMRELCGYTSQEVADHAGMSLEEYETIEEGNKDFPFSCLYRIADKFGIDIVELLTGKNPHLAEFTVVRAGSGIPIKRREEFAYMHLAAAFKNPISVPLYVTAPYDPALLEKPIELSTHEGQEFDYVLTGKLRVVHEGHIVDLNPGDSMYHDSGKPHGMIAASKEGCTFLAIVMKKEEK